MSTENAKDMRWIQAARRGDQAAFRQLVESHARRVFRVCLRVTGDETLADDAVQDTFLAVYRKLDEFAGQSQFGTWLHRIAVNASLQLMRKRNRYREDPIDEQGSVPPVSSTPSPDRQTEGMDMTRQLGIAMKQLSEMERMAFSLRHFEEFSIAEISDRLGVNESACKQAIFRAVGKMRIALAGFRDELGGESCSQ